MRHLDLATLDSDATPDPAAMLEQIDTAATAMAERFAAALPAPSRRGPDLVADMHRPLGLASLPHSTP